MDYDKTDMANCYDSGRSYSPDILRQWLDRISTHVPAGQVSHIVDLGCGTGRFSAPLAEHFDADVLGFDPSEKMLAQARAKQSNARVTYRQASGEELPVGDGSTDMVFMSMAFHHLQDPNRTARECHRILRRHGCVCLRNTTADAIETFPYLRFFPSVRAVIEQQLSKRDKIRSIFEGIGFNTIAHDIFPHPMSPDWTSFAAKTSLRADSFLARIPDDEFEAGMIALHEYARTAAPGQPAIVDVDLFVFQR